MFVGLFIYKELTFKRIREALSGAAELTGVTLIIMFTARVFSRLLIEFQVPTIVAKFMISVTDDVSILWIMILIFLLIIGMFMEALAAIMLVTPVLLPVMIQFGVDPVHFGIVLVIACAVGFSTPPLGENMFISSRVAGATLEETAISVLPLVGAMCIGMLLITFFPQISLFLPNVIGM